MFLGWGIIHSFFGEQAFTRAVFFTMFFWPVFLFWGLVLIFLRAEKNIIDNKHNFLSIAFTKAAVPIISAVAGIYLNLSGFKFPVFLWNFINEFAVITIPMILFVIGLDFKIKMKITEIKIALTSSFFRLIIGFILGIITVIFVKLIFSIDELTIKVVLLESIMPTATMSIFFIDFIDMDRKLLSGTITISTIISLLTIPIWFLIIDKYI